MLLGQKTNPRTVPEATRKRNEETRVFGRTVSFPRDPPLRASLQNFLPMVLCRDLQYDTSMPIFADRILYEDPYFLAVKKLSGELVVKGSGAVGKLPLFDFLKKQYPGIHPLNRLDFETSGIVLFARTRPILAQMMDADKAEWKKTYQAVVAGRLEKRGGVIDFPLPSRQKGERVAAQTVYRVLELFPRTTLVEAEIVSGKHHQIRRHFAMIQHPLALDSVYGDKKFNGHFNQAFKYKNFFLHASGLSFRHPITKELVKIEAPRPKAFEDVLKKMRDL